MKQNHSKAAVSLALTLILFGTLGTISRYITIPSSVMCCIRAYIGTIVLLLYLRVTEKRGPDFSAMRRNKSMLIIAGAMDGLNWLLIFEGFRHTTVAIASICYYMQPIFLMLCAPLFFKEKLPSRKIICIAVAFAGMVLVSDPFSDTIDAEGYKGIALSLLAAVGYTANVVASKKFRDISSVDATIAELFIAGGVLIPYIFATSDVGALEWSTQNIALTTLLGVLHTGIAYAVYYWAVRQLRADTVAVLGYIDPVTSVLLSVIVLREPLTLLTVVGAAMILGASCIGTIGKPPPDQQEDQTVIIS